MEVKMKTKRHKITLLGGPYHKKELKLLNPIHDNVIAIEDKEIYEYFTWSKEFKILHGLGNNVKRLRVKLNMNDNDLSKLEAIAMLQKETEKKLKNTDYTLIECSFTQEDNNLIGHLDYFILPQ